MPTLLPRESMDATSVIPAPTQRPSPSDHRVGFSSMFTRLLMGSLALRPALLLFGNSRPRVTATPLPHATGAHGQLPGRDFNPPDLLLLLRTARLALICSDAPCPAARASILMASRCTSCSADTTANPASSAKKTTSPICTGWAKP